MYSSKASHSDSLNQESQNRPIAATLYQYCDVSQTVTGAIKRLPSADHLRSRPKRLVNVLVHVKQIRVLQSAVPPNQSLPRRALPCFLTRRVPARKVALPSRHTFTTKAHPVKTGAAKPRVLASSATPLPTPRRTHDRRAADDGIPTAGVVTPERRSPCPNVRW